MSIADWLSRLFTSILLNVGNGGISMLEYWILLTGSASGMIKTPLFCLITTPSHDCQHRKPSEWRCSPLSSSNIGDEETVPSRLSKKRWLFIPFFYLKKTKNTRIRLGSRLRVRVYHWLGTWYLIWGKRTLYLNRANCTVKSAELRRYNVQYTIH